MNDSDLDQVLAAIETRVRGPRATADPALPDLALRLTEALRLTLGELRSRDLDFDELVLGILRRGA